MLRTISWTSTLGLAVAACASATPGARPHDMSAAQHEREGQSHASTAEAHAGQYEPNATVERTRCSPRGGQRGADVGANACWTSTSNPTADHLRAAEEHRRHAADHRAASAALRDAEERACIGISPDDRDMSPFDHVEDIASVEPLTERGGPSKAFSQRKAGAVVTFRAVPGMTAEWLQRVVDCHLARNASLGHAVPEMPNCPLVPNGVQARVTSTGNGFAVAIRAYDGATAREILARAERLRPRPVSSTAPTR
ncbi:MAG: hypothetical protein IT384_19140 [Deltaproteobacteria bacterium]|nr:hypothetical protein [Deltaproteobacteria bacterium]